MDELVDIYLREPAPAPMIDLTGGQPDLTPEWILWMMEAMKSRGIADRVYLWSDDNLSNDYFWQYLDDNARRYIASYPKYGRVGCFKGFNEDSFCFNTMAPADLFPLQFHLMKRLIELGIDMYAYVTFTTPCDSGIEADMRRFVDRLQDVHPNLPLRTVPLEIRAFTPVRSRINVERAKALELQNRAVAAWEAELQMRFRPGERAQPVWSIPLCQ